MATAKSIADEEGFEPCRDDRCSDLEIHPAESCRNNDKSAERNKLRCPLCAAQLITLPRKRARCANCQWRGSRAEAALTHGKKHA